MKTHTTKRTRALPAGLVIALFAFAGCDDFLTVENPGLVDDKSLNDRTIIPGLVVGMSAEFSRALPWVSRLIEEMTNGLTPGAYTWGPHVNGHLDVSEMDEYWNLMHSARWVAENGTARIEEILPAADYARSAVAARANLFAGFSNRLLGETVCYAVIDGGEAQPGEVHFTRAEAYFTKAAEIAQAVGSGAQDIHHAAVAGRASVRAWQGNWDAAVQDASLVPPAFVYNALFSAGTNRENNRLWSFFYVGIYGTLYNTEWAEPQDPRTPYVVLRDASGAEKRTSDGTGPAWVQAKYPNIDSPMPITSGKEMLLLRAEAALRANDFDGATDLMNASRAQYGMAPLTTPATETAAWELLRFERGATLWFEGRRYWDLSRWYEEGRDDFMEGRDRCMPIGITEVATNPNLAEFR